LDTIGPLLLEVGTFEEEILTSSYFFVELIACCKEFGTPRELGLLLLVVTFVVIVFEVVPEVT
jgi:hypothetical protein